MDPTPMVLLAACGGPRIQGEVEIGFDTEIANVGRVETPGIWGTRWGLSRNALDHQVDGDRLVGLPQGQTVFVQGRHGGKNDPVYRTEIATIRVPETGLPDLQVLVSEPEAAMATGYVAAAILDDDQSGIAVYDGQGRVVWGWQAPDDEVSASPVFAENGTDILAFFSDRDRNVDRATIRRIAVDGSEIRDTRATRGHHTFVDTGSPTFLSREFVDIDMAPYGIDESWLVMSDTIRGPGLTFDLLDHVDPFWPCTHFDTLHQRYGYTQVHDWSHGNSLVLDRATNTFLLGLRLHDAIHAIDGDTGGILWTATGDWSHAHFSEATADRVLLFDNGTHRDPPHSRVVELSIDAQGVPTEVWSFDQPDVGFTAWLGDARTLPNDNVLIAFTEIGEIVEVTRDHRIVWRAQTPASFVGRIRYTESLTPLPPG